MKHKECVNMHYIAKVTHFITVIPENFQFLPQVGSFLNKVPAISPEIPLRLGTSC